MTDAGHHEPPGPESRRRRIGPLIAGAVALALVAGASAVAAMAVAGEAGVASPPAPSPAAPSPPGVETSAPFAGSGSVIERDGRVLLCLEGQEQSLPPGCAGAVAELDGWDWAGIPHRKAAGVTFTQHPVTIRGTLAMSERVSEPPTLTLSEPIVPGALEPEAARGVPVPSGLSDTELQGIASRDLLDVIGPGTVAVEDRLVVARVAFDDGRFQGAVDEEFGHGAVFVRSLLRTEVVVQSAGGSSALVEPWPWEGGMEALGGGVLQRDDEGCLTMGEGTVVVFPHGTTLLADGSGVDVPGYGTILMGDAFTSVGGGVTGLAHHGPCRAEWYWLWQSLVD